MSAIKPSEVASAVEQVVDVLPPSLRDVAVQIFDAVHRVPEQVQLVLALKSFGFTNQYIADKLGHKDARWVSRVIQQWDPQRICMRGDEIRKIVLCSMADRVALEVLLRIREDDFENLPLDKRIDIVHKIAKIRETLQPKLLAIDEREEALLNKLKGLAAEDAGELEVDHGESG